MKLIKMEVVRILSILTVVFQTASAIVIYRDLDLEAITIDDTSDAPKLQELELVPDESEEEHVGAGYQGVKCETKEGVVGTCMTLEQCYPFFQHVHEYDLVKTGLLEFVENATRPCSSADDGKICCGERPVPFARLADLESSKSERNNGGGLDEQCKTNTPDKRIDGRYARPEEFPYAVSLLKNNVHYCSGALLTSSWVVTAAHCVNDIRDLTEFSVNVGELDISSPVDHTSRGVDKILYHSSFSMRFLKHDIALLRLREPVQISEKTRPICLPSLEEKLQSNNNLIGWGRPVAGPVPHSTVLHTILMRPVVTYQKCKEKLKLGPKANLLVEGMVCSETVARNFDLIEYCEGDSGSPLINKNVEGDKLIGLSSWSLGCRSKPGIYTDVRFYIKWIKRIVAKQ